MKFQWHQLVFELPDDIEIVITREDCSICEDEGRDSVHHPLWDFDFFIDGKCIPSTDWEDHNIVVTKRLSEEEAIKRKYRDLYDEE
jgi:hypothetical protein